ncbi:MAG: alpha/beta hydrolase [Candidatus Pseudomonas colombiensis]|nr:MAG: alpha/beta hydrolase [Pseudomonas sp.]
MPLRLLATLCLLGALTSVQAAERWQTLPPTPAPVATAQSGYAQVNGVKLYYTSTGQGSPVVLLHGGLANSDYWGLQVKALAAQHRVITLDSRGHGRSSRDARPFGYDLMADDVVAVLDQLKIPKADIVGWSDGAILGLDLAPASPDPRRQGVCLCRQQPDLGGQGQRRQGSDLRRLHRTGRQGVRQAVADAQGI